MATLHPLFRTGAQLYSFPVPLPSHFMGISTLPLIDSQVISIGYDYDHFQVTETKLLSYWKTKIWKFVKCSTRQEPLVRVKPRPGNQLIAAWMSWTIATQNPPCLNSKLPKRSRKCELMKELTHFQSFPKNKICFKAYSDHKNLVIRCTPHRGECAHALFSSVASHASSKLGATLASSMELWT